jgi:hypothetical protein
VTKYMLLLYETDVDEAGRAARWSELPEWKRLTDELRASGTLLANDALKPVDAATTVRVRDDDVQLVDGPFAVTKEILVGFYLVECEDLDGAVRIAQRLPTARHGSVEIRPVMTVEDIPSGA